MTTTTPTAAPPDAGVLAANLRAIARADPRLAARLAETPAHGSLSFAPTDQDGALSADLAGRALASRRRPIDEARRLASGVDLEKAGGVVVLGFGLGHHVAALADRCSEVSAIIVYEPDLPLLRAVLERVDHAEWIGRTELRIVTEADNAGALSASIRGVEGMLAVGVEFLEHPPSAARLGEGAARFSETFARVFGAMRTHVITAIAQSDATVRNELMNVGAYARWPGVADLAGAATGAPAIVVSAGPSLRRTIGLLKTPGLRDRCVIVAVQTVLRQLLDEGIRPHFVTAIDYHEISRRFYEGLTPEAVEGVTLVAEARANAAILDAFPGAKRLPHDPFVAELLGRDDKAERGTLINAATVAHLAYYLARHLGCDPVILTGQDLAFTDGQYYGAGAAIHGVWGPELNPFNSLEAMEWQRIVRSRPTLHEATDHLGRRIYTDEQMATYLAQFERDFLPDTERGLTIIDATEGGVRKAHTTPMSLAEALERHAPARRARPARAARRRTRGRRRRDRVRARDAAARPRRHAPHRASDPRVARAAPQGPAGPARPGQGRAPHRRGQRRARRGRGAPARLLAADARQPDGRAQAVQGPTGRSSSPRASDRYERQRRQIERDMTNLDWIAEFADLLDDLLGVSDASFDGAPKRTSDAQPRADDTGEAGEARPIRTGALVVVTGGAPDPGATLFGRPLLRATLERLARCAHVDEIVVVAEDPGAVRAIAEGLPVRVLEGPAPDPARARAIAAARRWAPACWRGGLGGMTAYDEIFDPVRVERAMEETGLDAALVVGADWALVDPALCDAVIERHAENPEASPIAFTQAPPGLCGCVVSRAFAADLAGGQRSGTPYATIGAALAYLPMRPRHDPIARPCCVQIDAVVRTTPERLVPDTPGARATLEAALAGLDPAGADARAVCDAVRAHAAAHEPGAPRELVLEVTASRASFGPRFDWAGPIPARDEMTIADAASIVERHASARNDAVLTLAGFGDPLEWSHTRELIGRARDAGIAGVHLRTDLVCDVETARSLPAWGADVVSVDVLANTRRHLRGAHRRRRVRPRAREPRRP